MQKVKSTEKIIEVCGYKDKDGVFHDSLKAAQLANLEYNLRSRRSAFDKLISDLTGTWKTNERYYYYSRCIKNLLEEPDSFFQFAQEYWKIENQKLELEKQKNGKELSLLQKWSENFKQWLELRLK